MGFYRLVYFLIVVAAIALLGVGLVRSETRQAIASASIQATATVVPALGITSIDQEPAVGSYYKHKQLAESPYAGELLVRYPSKSGVQVSIHREVMGEDKHSIVPLASSLSDGTMRDASAPGAAVLKSPEMLSNIADDNAEYVITLIYTEN